MAISSISQARQRWSTPTTLRLYFSRASYTLLMVVVGVSLLSSASLYQVPGVSNQAAVSQLGSPIKHIIIMMKENRTFDNLFGTFPGADGATTYTDPYGKVHPLNHQPDPIKNDISHSHDSFVLAYDHGKLDKFSLLPGAIQDGVDEADSQLTTFHYYFDSNRISLTPPWRLAWKLTA